MPENNYSVSLRYDKGLGFIGPARGILSDPNRLAMLGEYNLNGTTLEIGLKDGGFFKPAIYLSWARGVTHSTTNLASLMPKNLGDPWKSIIESLPESKASIQVDIMSLGGKLYFPFLYGGKESLKWEFFTPYFGAGVYFTRTKAVIDNQATSQFGAGATTVMGIKLLNISIKHISIFLTGDAQVYAGTLFGAVGRCSGGVGYEF